MSPNRPITCLALALLGYFLADESAAARVADPEIAPQAADVPQQPAEPVLAPADVPLSPKLPRGVRSDSSGDRDLEMLVVTALAGDPYLAEVPVEIAVQSRVVSLIGSVGEGFLRNWAEDTVKAVPGVRAVRNYLLLNHVPPRKRDWEIREEIQWRLGFSPIVNARDVGVRVEDGVAYLTGTVDTLQEREVASRQAAQVATRLVVDELIVQHRVPILRVPTCPPVVHPPGPEHPLPFLPQAPGPMVE